MIYSKNIHFEEGYEFIQYAVKTAIEEYKKKVIIDSKKSRRKILHLRQKNVLVYNQNQIEEIVKGNQQLYDKCYSNNSLEVITQSSSTEQIANALKVDGACVVANIVSSKNQHLVVNPSFVDDILDTVESTDDKCSHNFITKKYTSQSELEQDNGVEILYYDVGFDDTPYEILELYEEERSKDNFDAFLRKQLIEKHSCPTNASAELADTLIRGKKQILNDEYAVLIVDDTQNVFQRKLATNKWVIDKTVKPEIFINNNDLFKNINHKKNKTKKNNSSDTITVHRNMYVAEFKTRLDELNNRLTIENSIIAPNLSGFITRNNNLKYIQSHKQNIFSVELSKHISIDNTLKSPYISLRDNIISHQNFPEKQHYMILFAEQYTRKPILSEPSIIDSENSRWLYCKKTNTKLLPRFILELAQAFKNGMYQHKLSQICNEFGDLDGQGTYYDINSGYTILKVDFVDSSPAHAIIENTEEVTTNNFFHRSKKVIDLVFQAICSKLGIRHKEKDFRDFVLKNGIEMIDFIEDEESYQLKLDFIKKKRQQNHSTVIRCIF